MKKSLTLVAAAIIIAMLILGAYFYILQTQNTGITYTSSAQISTFVTEFPTQTNETAPNSIAVDSQGSVWFTLQNESILAKLIPGNGTIDEYPLPGAKSSGSVTWGIAIDSARNLVWFTEQVSNAVWSFNMINYKFTEYSLKTPAAFPFGLTIDKQGNVWFTEIFGNKLGEITTSGNLSEFNIPLSAQYLEPSGITVDNSDRIWFTIAGADGVASFYQGQYHFYNLTGLIVSPVGIAADDYGNLWITQHGPSFLSEFNPASGFFKTISTSIPPLNSSYPYFVYTSPSGNIWFNEHYGNAIARYNPTTKSLTEYLVPTRFAYAGDISGMLTMSLSPLTGNPWFTEYFSGKVGTVNSSASINLNIGIENNSGLNSAISVPNGSSSSLTILVNSTSTSMSTLKTAVGNFSGTSRFAFSFSQSRSSGSFSSNLTITNQGSAAGVYFVTVSAETSNIVVSRIIQVDVP
ncbi:MAG: Vgb family protein [Nitrososphaerales archaeon]